ncbi:probable proline--tRNA ligase, mitochondrial [Belonocnema kinseyi]|uniref:probable proline--tRNA ligase, mitochondrial n=1 Tax=Belonocnema kinseyi TaxID=2817044 RepID=UPI00143DDF23|nr:probable proline--tRNA ligase, mitochondrial [Belonocnema kinseyi]
MSRKVINNMGRCSQIFQPVNIAPKDAPVKADVSKSYKHMVDAGIIRKASTGMYTLLPLGLRVLEKLTDIVDQEMLKAGAQKILLPALTSEKLWKKTNRLTQAGRELFTLRDRHNNSYVLSPTHEETVTDLISIVGPLSPKSLPLRLYQISSKWRDEMKPRLGFIRGREFIMKDLYTFDAGPEEAKITYDIVNKAYENIFKQIGVPFTKALGSTGIIGGSMSHEYHYSTDVGEDTVLSCSQCDYHVNENATEESICPSCKSSLVKDNTIEVGHTFLLETKYSEPLHATYHSGHGHKPLSMGCYGLGMTRLIAASVEVLSTDQELRWPVALAPYTVCVIPPKAGSKEEIASPHVERICEILSQSNVDFIIDDRTNLTIGNRLIYSRKCGFPFVIVIGKLATGSSPLFEFHDLTSPKREDVSIETLFSFFNNQDTKSTEEIKREATIAS